MLVKRFPDIPIVNTFGNNDYLYAYNPVNTTVDNLWT